MQPGWLAKSLAWLRSVTKLAHLNLSLLDLLGHFDAADHHLCRGSGHRAADFLLKVLHAMLM
jgi:hypothetical protein